MWFTLLSTLLSPGSFFASSSDVSHEVFDVGKASRIEKWKRFFLFFVSICYCACLVTDGNGSENIGS